MKVTYVGDSICWLKGHHLVLAEIRWLASNELFKGKEQSNEGEKEKANWTSWFILK